MRIGYGTALGMGLGVGIAGAFAGVAFGQTQSAGANTPSNVFDLGQIEQVTVTASPLAEGVSESTVSSEGIYRFNALTVDRALDLVAGAQSGNTGGPRNERLLFIRGFDRFQSPLYIDGIRVYLPADNRLDLGFFPTADLAQIQVEKGYVSVLSGPGALGGALNLVTRKPTEPFEYEGRAGLSLAGDGSYDGYNTSALVGGRTDQFYLQASGAITDTTRFKLSDDYTPTATQAAGFRDNSLSRNYSVNLKAGYTPNSTDEYSLSYSGEWGRKDAPFSVSDPVSTQRDWTWPYWDVQSVYFLSNTALGPNAYLKTKLYYNSFLNGLFSYDNANFTTQSTPKAFRSYYDDYAYGGSIELGNQFGERDLLKGAFFYRRDSHDEWETIYSPSFTEPHQVSIEDTYSLALENRFHITDALDFVAGASYDWRHLLQAQDYVDPTNTAPGVFVNYPLADGHADNAQAEFIYNFSPAANLYVNVSDRARFPTLMDRFSTRFNSALSNPNLLPERAVNYEIGGSDTLFDNLHVDAAVFISHVSDAIESVPILFNGSATTQSQNVGSGNYYGLDLSADSRVTDTLQLGLRFSYINRNLDAQDPNNPVLTPNFHLTGEPYDQLLVFADYDILPDLSVMPSIQADSDRWTTNTAGTAYFKTGSFFLFNLEADYRLTDRMDVSIGARNLFDLNYQLVAGFPEEGRSFFLNLRIRS